MSTVTQQTRSMTADAFDEAYREVILGNPSFVEEPDYYHWHKSRYRKTVERICRLPLQPSSRVLEIGGGQIILLLNKLFDDVGVLADVSDRYVEAVTRYGMTYHVCDLLHDDIPERGTFDLIVMCEVIEHMTVPPHLILAKMKRWLRPGGYIFLTTPNLYRFRNVARLALGMPLFCNFFYPKRGQGIGHPIEYSEQALRWQLEQAGFDVTWTELTQLMNVGSTPATKITRTLMTPLLMRRLWRDNLVAVGQRPERDTEDGDGDPVAETNPYAEALLSE